MSHGFPMSVVHVLSIGLALALCAAPVLVLRRSDHRSSEPGESDGLSPAVIGNSWIASALRVSLLVPLFALGASGDVWPAIAGAVGFGAGVYLLGAMHRRAAVPVGEAGRESKPPSTLPAFVAETCGGAGSIRVVVASVSVVGSIGLVCAEAAALVIVTKPLLGEGGGLPLFLILIGTAVLYGVAAGRDRVRLVSQSLLGASYIGLFGSAAFLLYLHASDLRPMPPHGALALLALTACCVAILIYRQTKYVDTPRLVAPEEPSRWRRIAAQQVRWMQRVANIAISIFAVLIVVIAGMEVVILGLPDILRGGVEALRTPPRMSAAGVASIALLAFAYPLVDPMGWRSADALAARAAGAGVGKSRPISTVAGETALIAIMVAALGGIAALSTDLPPDDPTLPGLIRQLVVFDNGITDTASTLLVVGAFAMASATMGMAVTTAVEMIRADFLPATRPGRHGSKRPDGGTAAAVVAGLAVVIAAIWIVSGAASAGVADSRFLALALAFAGLQVALLPLLLSRLRGFALPAAAPALAVIGGGVAASLGCVASYLATGDMAWLWLSIPACLASGFLILAATSRRIRAFDPPR